MAKPNVKNVELKDLHEELQKIRKLLVLQLLSNGISEEIIDKAVEMGAGNIRGYFSKKAIKESIAKWNKKDAINEVASV
jgi:16S rRNA U1498 N3-methylase RsmE